MENSSTNENSKKTKLTYTEWLDKVIKAFPIYYNIFEKYYSGDKNTSYGFDSVYKSLFGGLVEYYQEFMLEGIEKIVEQIKIQYNPTKPYASIDYIEFLFGNVLYETFIFELKKIPLDKNLIGYEYLCICEYIIRVELFKYKLYNDIIKDFEQSNQKTKLLDVMNFRVGNLIKRISFVIGFLESEYSEKIDIIELCKNLISEFDSNLSNKIEPSIYLKTCSFIKINKS